MSIFCRLLGHLLFRHPKGEGAELSVHMTMSDAGSLLKKLTAASGRSGSPSMKVVTVNFGKGA